MSADVSIIYKQMENVLSIPTAAIEYNAGSAAVHIQTGNDEKSVPVTLGAIGTEWAEVTSGLKEGDLVIVN